MQYYAIDLVKFTKILPPTWRRPKLTAYAKALLRGHSRAFIFFNNARLANLYYANRNGQIAKLTGVLNDAFDAGSRGIYITELFIEPLPLYLEAERRPIITPLASETTTPYEPPYLYTGSEIGTGYDFTVHVPTAAAAAPGYSAGRISALIDKYRLPSKNNYLIVIY
jgi:hypothetical protein